jgi:hypothetical protein
MTDEIKSPYLNAAEAARYLRLKKRTLDNMRWLGTGPKYRKHGGRICYHIDELEAWSQSREYRSTSGD